MTTYYVATAGNDTTGDGSIGTPYATLGKAFTVAGAGDAVLGNGGDVFRETGTLSAANQTLGAYGTGKPRVYGSGVPGSWTTESYSPSSVPTKIQGAFQGVSASASVTKSFTSTPIAGNLLVAVGAGSTVIGNAAIAGWTLAVSALQGTTSTLGIWYKVAGVGESKDVTLTWTGSTSTLVGISEWTNMGATPLDQVAHTDNSGAGTSRSSGTTGTTTTVNELLIAAFGTGNTVSAESYTNSFVEEFASGAVLYSAALVVAATGTYESTMSWTTSRVSGGVIATFKAGASAARTLYYTAQAADPLAMWFIATDTAIHTGTKQASKDALASEYDWWFDAGNSRLYVFAATDPLARYTSVEVASTSRDRGITYSVGHDYQYAVVDGFEVAFVAGNGIVLRGHSQIINNHVHHLGLSAATNSTGCELQNAIGSRIAYNTIHNTAFAGAECIASVAPTPYNDEDNVIEYNTISDCASELINIHSEVETNVASGHIIRYNTLFHTNGYVPNTSLGHGIHLVGFVSTIIDGPQIHHNTITVAAKALWVESYVSNPLIAHNTLRSTTGIALDVGATGVTGVTVKNNVVADAALYGVRITDLAALAACDYNCWYAPTGAVYARIGSTSYGAADFAAYKAASGFDANSKWQDPLFANAAGGDFTLQSGSPAIDAGVYIAGINDGYFGSAPDIGYWESNYVVVTPADTGGGDRAKFGPTGGRRKRHRYDEPQPVYRWPVGMAPLGGIEPARPIRRAKPLPVVVPEPVVAAPVVAAPVASVRRVVQDERAQRDARRTAAKQFAALDAIDTQLAKLEEQRHETVRLRLAAEQRVLTAARQRRDALTAQRKVDAERAWQAVEQRRIETEVAQARDTADLQDILAILDAITD